MNRSGYCDDVDDWARIKWRGQVMSAIRGKRGQALLCDILAALDAIPDKCLIASDFELDDGHCTLGAAAKHRGIDMTKLDPEDPDSTALQFDVAPCLVREIEYVNDEAGPYGGETPQQRWVRVRKWVVDTLERTKKAS